MLICLYYVKVSCALCTSLCHVIYINLSNAILLRTHITYFIFVVLYMYIMCVLNILILVRILMLDDFQMFHRFAKLARAFVILYRTSTVESPLAVILLPWYTKSLTSSVLLLLAVPLLSFFELIFINFVSLTFILSPICLLYLTLSSILLWISLCRCVSKTVSSAKSRSSSDCYNVQDIPLSACLVVVFISQYMQRLKSSGENMYPCRTPVWIGKLYDSSVPQITFA